MNWWNGWGPPPPPNWGPPTQNYYYPPPAPPPPPAEVKKQEDEWKKWIRFRNTLDKEKNKKKDEKKEKKGLQKVTQREYPFSELLLWIIVLGPAAGTIYNKLEALITKLIAAIPN